MIKTTSFLHQYSHSSLCRIDKIRNLAVTTRQQTACVMCSWRTRIQFATTDKQAHSKLFATPACPYYSHFTVMESFVPRDRCPLGMTPTLQRDTTHRYKKAISSWRNGTDITAILVIRGHSSQFLNFFKESIERYYLGNIS